MFVVTCVNYIEGKPAAGGKKSNLVHTFRFSHGSLNQINCHLKSENFWKKIVKSEKFLENLVKSENSRNPPSPPRGGIHSFAKWRKVTQVTKITGNFSDLRVRIRKASEITVICDEIMAVRSFLSGVLTLQISQPSFEDFNGASQRGFNQALSFEAYTLPFGIIAILLRRQVPIS